MFEDQQQQLFARPQLEDISYDMMIKNKKEVRAKIKQERAKFKFKTCDIIRMFLTCKICQSEYVLRKSVVGRSTLNYLNGELKLNKELDVANIILAQRRQK